MLLLWKWEGKRLEVNVWYSEFLVAGCQQNFKQVIGQGHRVTEAGCQELSQCWAFARFLCEPCVPTFSGMPWYIPSCVMRKLCTLLCLAPLFGCVFGVCFCFLYNHAILVPSWAQIPALKFQFPTLILPWCTCAEQQWQWQPLALCACQAQSSRNRAVTPPAAPPVPLSSEELCFGSLFAIFVTFTISHVHGSVEGGRWQHTQCCCRMCHKIKVG